jgi:hypothetical protein
MSAFDRMKASLGAAKEAPIPGNKPPSAMEAVMLRMLEGVGLDANALGKMQTDVMQFALFCKTKLETIEEQNKQLLAALERMENDNRNSRNDGK